MATRWKAVVLATLSWATTAAAQMPMMPPGYGGGPPPTPNFAGEPTPQPVGQFCAPGPGKQADSPFSLPQDGSPNAFTEDCPCGSQQTGTFFNIGALGLMRQSLGNGVTVQLDPQNIDTGIQPPPGQPVAARFNNVSSNFNFGVKAALGYREGGYAVELCGFYLPSSNNSSAVANPGRLDLPFGAFPSPIGFQGNNFLWTQADRVTSTFQTELANLEANFRFGDAFCFEWITGLRAMYVREQFGLQTEDDSLVVQPVNPTQVALYQVQTKNQLLLAQFGFEWEQALISRVAVGGFGKIGAGANFSQVNQRLERGDGFVGFNQTKNNTGLGYAGELGVFADILITDQWRLRLGYQALWIGNVSEAVQNVDFNLSNQGANINNNGSIFYHGPAIEFQFVF